MSGAATLIEKFSSLVAQKMFEEIKMVTGFKEDFEALCEELDSIKSLLEVAREKSNLHSMSPWIGKLEDFVYDAMTVVEECREASESRNPLFRSRKFRNPLFRFRFGRKIRILKKKITKIHGSARYVKYLSSTLDLNARALNNSEGMRERSASLLRESVAVGIGRDLKIIRGKILDDSTQFIAVWGIGGQGKTHLLKHLKNEERVRQSFDHVVWTDVTQKFDHRQILLHIAREINPSFAAEDSDEEKIKILTNKKCLFILDDVWQTNALSQLNLPLDHSKIVITTRDKRVALESMAILHSNENSFIHEKTGLSHEDSLKLFCTYAFPELREPVPPETLSKFVHEMVKNFAGHPLAIKARARSMCNVRLPKEWERILAGVSGNALNDEVMLSLTISYKALPHHLKSCFLYCSSFPKSTRIKSEYLVYGWIAQGFVSTQVPGKDAYELACSYLDELVDRGLLEIPDFRVARRSECCKMHDLFHELALTESSKESKCLFQDGQDDLFHELGLSESSKEIKCLFQDGQDDGQDGNERIKFPKEKCKDLWTKFLKEKCKDLRRFSLTRAGSLCRIEKAISCPRLHTLILSYNYSLESIFPDFFSNLRYLRVLDLSNTAITSLPKSIKKCTNILFLNLSQTKIVDLPESLSSLKRLQFLDVSECQNLKSLHSKISKNQFLQYLNMEGCKNIIHLPVGISKLACLRTLKGVDFKTSTAGNANTLQWRHLKELKCLEHLSADYHEEMECEQTVASSSMHGTFEGMTNSWTFPFTNNCERHGEMDPEITVASSSMDGTCEGMTNMSTPPSTNNYGRYGEMEPEQTVASSSMDGPFVGMTNMSSLAFKNNSEGVLRLPKDFTKMKLLEMVSLYRCVVPQSIPDLENLMELELRADSASGDDYKGIEKIPNLRKLHLLDNDKCVQFPEEFGKPMAFPKLEDLKVQNFTLLSSFPPVEDNAMSSLKWLQLVDCKIKSMPGLERLRRLEEVKVRVSLNDLQEAENLRNQPCWQTFSDRKIKRELKMHVHNPN